MKSIKMKLVTIIVLLCLVVGGVLVFSMNMAYQRNMSLMEEYASSADADSQAAKDELLTSAGGNRNRAMGVAIALAVLQGVVLIVAVNMLVFKRIDAVISDTTRFIGGEFDTAIPKRNDDEMGEIEGALEEFRVLMVDTMNQVPSQD